MGYYRDNVEENGNNGNYDNGFYRVQGLGFKP